MRSISAGVISQFDYTYNAAGRITGWTLAAQSNQYALGYDAACQLNSATLQSGGSIVHQYAFGYDAASNRTTQQTDMMVTTAAPNNLNQLTSLAAGGRAKMGNIWELLGDVWDALPDGF